MIVYIAKPNSIIRIQDKEIFSFISGSDKNVDSDTIKSFGDEWESFHQFTDDEIIKIGDDYFDIVTDEMLHKGSIALDVGCGSGRWSIYVSRIAKFVEAIDPSEAVKSAYKQTSSISNIRITQAGVDSIPFPDNSFDFVFSLGVLHHIPDTKKALASCVKKLKPGGSFLVYLYYNLDNRGGLYKFLFSIVNVIRKIISKFPKWIKKRVTDLIAVIVYWPLARLSWVLQIIGLKRASERVPLSYYRDKSFYIMRNDSLDRFGTPLEQRFSRKEIEMYMKECGLEEIKFSEKEPYWHAVGKKK